jgi:hypothetical protein
VPSDRAQYQPIKLLRGETESIEVRQFSWDEIRWNEIAFPSVRWALHAWYDTRGFDLPAVVLNPLEDERGILPLPGVQQG